MSKIIAVGRCLIRQLTESFDHPPVPNGTFGRVNGKMILPLNRPAAEATALVTFPKKKVTIGEAQFGVSKQIKEITNKILKRVQNDGLN